MAKADDLLTTDINVQVLFATGDVMAQQGVERAGIKKHDFARTGRMTLYGGGTSPLVCTPSESYYLRLFLLP